MLLAQGTMSTLERACWAGLSCVTSNQEHRTDTSQIPLIRRFRRRLNYQKWTSTEIKFAVHLWQNNHIVLYVIGQVSIVFLHMRAHTHTHTHTILHSTRVFSWSHQLQGRPVSSLSTTHIMLSFSFHTFTCVFPLPGMARWLRGKESTCQCRMTHETWVQSLGWEDLLEEEMATHSSILAWEILWTEEPGGLQSMGSWRDNRYIIPASFRSGYWAMLGVPFCL